MEIIPNATLRALGFHHFLFVYLEEKTSQFVDVTDKPELAIEPKVDGQPIIDSEDEKAKKELERVAKRKAQRNNLCVPISQTLATGFVAPLSSHPPGPALSSHLRSPTPLSSHLPRSPIPLSRPPMPTLSSCFLVPTLMSCLFVPALSSCSPIPASLSPPLPVLSSSPPVPALLSFSVPALLSYSMLGPAPTCFISSALKTFK